MKRTIYRAYRALLITLPAAFWDAWGNPLRPMFLRAEREAEKGQ
jgi:hypothetical protein